MRNYDVLTESTTWRLPHGASWPTLGSTRGGQAAQSGSRPALEDAQKANHSESMVAPAPLPLMGVLGLRPCATPAYNARSRAASRRAGHPVAGPAQRPVFPGLPGARKATGTARLPPNVPQEAKGGPGHCLNLISRCRDPGLGRRARPSGRWSLAPTLGVLDTFVELDPGLRPRRADSTAAGLGRRPAGPAPSNAVAQHRHPLGRPSAS